MSSRSAALQAVFSASPLYAILDTAWRERVPPSAAMDALLRAGVKVIQYRHKGAFLRAHWDDCCDLAAKARQAGAIFIVNDRADIAKGCGAAGVHLGQDDLPPEKARQLAESLYIGFSTHSLEQARSAMSLPVDYIAVGPVFVTASKQNPDPVVGTGLIDSVCKLASKPVVGIGGITLDNAASVLQAGASAVAVISDLLNAPDLEDRARRFKRAHR